MAKKTGLGRGMAALLPVVSTIDDKQYFLCPIEQVRPNRNQPRKQFSAEKLEELAASIREKGIIQPLVVAKQDGYYEIIAGERRWRAAQKAGLRELPVVIRDASEDVVMELALIENIQREDLNSIEEAQAYRVLVEQFGISQEEVARRVGKNRTTVTNALRLLRLPDEVQQDLLENRLTMGHARAILGLEDEELIMQARNEILKRMLNVRGAEELVKRLKRGVRKAEKLVQQPDLLMNALEEQLQKQFQTRIAIKRGKTGKGALEIYFNSDDELIRIIDLIQA
jgi:ParB family chromosome partitioning protein